MADKIIKTRIQMKNDTLENWEKATGFIPKAGEIIIYNVDANHSEPRMKIGDGINTVVNLPFFDRDITDAEIDAICGGANIAEEASF